MPFSQPRATRVDGALMSEAARLVLDAGRRDEMAGPSYLHPIPLVRWVFWKRLDAVARFLKAGTARYESGLDFGCGLGVLLPTLSAMTRQVFATDLAMAPARRLASALMLDNVTFVDPADLGRRIQPESLDYAVSADVLEHVDDLAWRETGHQRSDRKRPLQGRPRACRFRREGRLPPYRYPPDS